MNELINICTKNTRLSKAQIEYLDKISLLFPFIADISYSQVTMYVRDRVKSLIIVAQAKPHTSFFQYKPNSIGSMAKGSEEPLIWRTFRFAKHIQGKREWAVGLLLDMYTFPLYDSNGEMVAVICFETNYEEIGIDGYNHLLETVFSLISTVQLPIDKNKFRPLLASDGIIVVNENGKIAFANTAAASIYKVLGVGNIIGHHIFDREITRHITKKTTISNLPYEMEIEVGEIVLVQRLITIPKNKKEIKIIVVSDVTEIKKKEKQLLIKATVIQEIHHRVKNNLQTIASLLRLQARRSTSLEVKAALEESINRILSISVVHEFLSQQGEDFIDVAEVAKNILDLVVNNMLDPGFNLTTKFSSEKVILPSEKACSLALVINELILNSLEHGFAGNKDGTIGIEIVIRADHYLITIYDNGHGLPPEFDLQRSKSLGLQIVRTLVQEDLGGTINFKSDIGTYAVINIPIDIERGI